MTKRELQKVVAAFRAGILDRGRGQQHEAQRMCFVVCAPLESFLSVVYGIETRLIEGAIGDSNHFWLELADGSILDPTADQFNHGKVKMPSIYIGPRPKHYKVVKQV